MKIQFSVDGIVKAYLKTPKNITKKDIIDKLNNGEYFFCLFSKKIIDEKTRKEIISEINMDAELDTFDFDIIA